MVKIAPSLLSCDFMHIADEIEKLEQSGVDYLHFDVMDGQFVPNISFAFPILNQMRKLTELTLDVHLMVENPERYINMFAEAGSDIITVHVEATQHIHRAIQMIRESDVKCGVTLNPGTPVEVLEPVLNEVDLVLVMSVNPGFGGQKFIDNALNKIKWLDEYRKTHQLTYEIEVDGGINDETATQAVNNGADVLVAGSYFFKHEDYMIAVNTLKGE